MFTSLKWQTRTLLGMFSLRHTDDGKECPLSLHHKVLAEKGKGHFEGILI
jgi:hypothetical protein